jgi:hypothetical protein
MKIHVFLRTAGEGVEARRKRYVLRCFYKGLLVEGADAHLVDGQGYEPCDVAIVLGGRPSGGRPFGKRAATQAVRDDIFTRHQGPFVFIETPLLGRHVYRRAVIAAYVRKLLRLGRPWYSDKVGYYRVGVNGFLQDDADFNNAGSPPDRWELLSRAFGLRLKPYRQSGRHVLIVGQNPGDTSLRGADIFDWMHRTAVQARRVTERRIVVRPHPVTPQAMMQEFEKRFVRLEGIVLDHPPRRSIRTVLQDCWVLLAYSSSATIDALIEGIPCITLSPANLAWPLSDHDLERIEHPTLFEREQWLYDLAYAQWSPEEMQAGIVWRHLQPAVVSPRTKATAWLTV